tara:strand:+ start:1773 stop:1997 length:225 start_codon:yes stop_codon:yes gene_type:complete
MLLLALLLRLLRALPWSSVALLLRPIAIVSYTHPRCAYVTHLFALARGALERGFVLWTLWRILERHVHVVIIIV